MASLQTATASLDRPPSSVDRSKRTLASLLTTDPEQQILLRGAFRWTKCFWVLGLVLVFGLTLFRDAIVSSIESTPHPVLVYTIFVIAAVAAVLCALLLATVVRELAWFERFRRGSEADRTAMICRRDPADDLSTLYHLTLQTRELPIGQRKQALDHELDCAEATLMGRAALPTLLSGSLVGVGLVGTFVGLLGTLHDLSAVFSAFGGTSGDSAASFSSMIQKLRGPIQGMGTAFVASLYGLLGSLVIGLVALTVRRVGDELFSALRLYVSEELYIGGATLSTEPVEGESELGASMRILAAVTREEHGKLREGMEQWSRALDERLQKVATITAGIGAEVQEAADYVGTAARRSVDSLEKARETNERLFFGMNEVSKGLIDRLDRLNSDLANVAGKRQSLLISIALAISLLTAGVALGVMLQHRSAPTASPAAVDGAAGTDPAIRSVAPDARQNPAVASPVPPAAALSPGAPSAGTPAAGAPVAGTPQVTGGRIVARNGDTLSGIARREGVPLPDLVAANPQIRNTDEVDVGQEVQMPPR